jgi:predicted phage terminase large subunit-like protein
MFSRTRRLLGTDIPIRIRAASNPGNKHAAWVKERFITNRTPDRFFIPARVYDNPHLDVEEYKRSLMEMDPINRERILNGDWEVSEEGTVFQKHWFNTISATELPSYAQMKLVRAWDLAGTEVSEANPDPDWTVGTLLGRHLQTGEVFVIDVKMCRKNAGFVKRLVGDTARSDGRGVKVLIEMEGGSSGKALIADYVQSLPGFDVRGVRPTGDKVTRAIPVASMAEAGLISMMLSPWREFALAQLGIFGTGVGHDDFVDTLSLGIGELTGGVRKWSPEDFKRLFQSKPKDDTLSPMQLLQSKYGFGRALPPPKR